jgi:hypothetical protein
MRRLGCQIFTSSYDLARSKHDSYVVALVKVRLLFKYLTW